jgi:hypothetical protein
MNLDSAIQVDAPARTVWAQFADVERWCEWTASVDQIVALDGPELVVGHRFRIEQPGYPKLVWEVTDVDPGTSWTWRHRSVGTTATATHEVRPIGADRTEVRQHLEQRGILGVVVGTLTRRRAKRYLALEAEGLKARSELVRRAATA